MRWISGSLRTVTVVFRKNSSNFRHPKLAPKLIFYPTNTISALRVSVCCFMSGGAEKQRRLLFSRPVRPPELLLCRWPLKRTLQECSDVVWQVSSLSCEFSDHVYWFWLVPYPSTRYLNTRVTPLESPRRVRPTDISSS